MDRNELLSKENGYTVSIEQRKGFDDGGILIVRDLDGRLLARRALHEVCIYPVGVLTGSGLTGDEKTSFMLANAEGGFAHDRCVKLAIDLLERMQDNATDDVIYKVISEGECVATFTYSEYGTITSGIGPIDKGYLPVYLQEIVTENWAGEAYIELDDVPHKKMKEEIGQSGFIFSPSWAAGVSVRVRSEVDDHSRMALRSTLRQMPVGESVYISATGETGPISLSISLPQMHLLTAAHKQVLNIADGPTKCFGSSDTQAQNLLIASKHIEERAWMTLAELWKDSGSTNICFASGVVPLTVGTLINATGEAGRWLTDIDNAPAFSNNFMLVAMLRQMSHDALS